MENWQVYLLQCKDGTYYCGLTNDLDKRIEAHNSGQGSKYTRSRLPVQLIASSSMMSKSKAHQLEYLVKKQPRSIKVKFLMNYNSPGG